MAKKVMTKEMAEELFNELKQRYEIEFAVTFFPPTWHDGWGQVEIINNEGVPDEVLIALGDKSRFRCMHCADQIDADIRAKNFEYKIHKKLDKAPATSILEIKTGNW